MADTAIEGSAKKALRMGGAILLTAFVLSFVVNILRLAGPIFMVLVYDRVLASRSEETLVALFIMVAVLMLILGLLEYVRRRILARFGAQFQERLENNLFDSTSQNEMFESGKSKPANGLDEVDGLRGFFHSGSLIAVFDFFWVPMFLAFAFILHPYLGWLSFAGILVMFALILLQMAFMGGRGMRATAASKSISDLKTMMAASREVVRSQEMTQGFKHRWLSARQDSRDRAIALKDWTVWFSSMSSTTLLIVRYSVLAVGAYLTLKGELTVGAMVASTFLVSRILTPVDNFFGELPNIGQAIAHWRRLQRILANRAAEVSAASPADGANARARLSLGNVSVRSPITGALLLKQVSIDVAKGQMLEILGASGGGKTVLAETILGLSKRSAGTILCNGLNLTRMTESETAVMFGYVPETAKFIAGTLQENISHLAVDPDPEKVASAARQARLLAFINALPDGFQTQIDAVGTGLSKGQRYQLALARALYHDPQILIIDEPDPVLLDVLPKTMEKTFNAVLGRGGVIILLARKPLALVQARTQFSLESGVLKQVRQIAATVSQRDADESGKPANVTVLAGKKGDNAPGNQARG